MKNLIVISAPSGAGKTTLCKHIQKNINYVHWSRSHTTRSPRSSEQDGIDYDFISKIEFKELIDTDSFAEWNFHHNNYYGTIKSNIENFIQSNKMLLLELDVKGAMSISKLYPLYTLSIFVLPPTVDDLRIRLSKRGANSKIDIEQRLNRLETELKYKNEFNFVIINDNLDKAKNEILNIIQNNNKKE